MTCASASPVGSQGPIPGQLDAASQLATAPLSATRSGKGGDEPARTQLSTPTRDEPVAGEARRVVLAASVASVLTKAVLHPIDTLKCRLQVVSMSTSESVRTTSGPTAIKAIRTPAAANITKPTLSSVWHLKGTQPTLSLSQRWRQVRAHYAGSWGPRYLYGGLPVKLLMYVPYQTVYITTYEATKKLLRTTEAQQRQSADHPVQSHMWRTVVAAVTAEISSCAIRIPMETVKMRIQATKANSTSDAFRQMRYNGARAYARLIVPHLLAHDIPYSIIQWVVYETLRPWTMQWYVSRTESGADRDHAVNEQSSSATAASARTPWQSFWYRYGTDMQRAFMSGGFSGFLASTLSIPLDNIRTRTVVASANNSHITARQVVRRTLQQEGVRGFFKGGGMRVLWVTSNLACYFPIFELMKKLLADSGV